jgi:hypothetical protein
MPAHIPMRGHCDRHRREQRGEQRDECEEVTRAIERLAHLRLAVLQRLERDATHLAAIHLVMRELREARHRCIRARDQQPIGHTAAEGDEAGRLDIVGTQHQTRRKIDEREATVEFAGDHRADHEAAGPDLDGVADMQLQCVEQGLIDPYRTGAPGAAAIRNAPRNG